MDFEYLGYKIIFPKDPSYRHVTNLQETAEAMEGHLVEAMGQYVGIPLARVFICSQELLDDPAGLEIYAEGLVRELAEDIDKKTFNLPVELVASSVAEPEWLYSEEAHKNHGEPAEQAVVDYFKSLVGPENVVRHPNNKYGVDIGVRMSEVGAWFYVDTECKTAWGFDEFPFNEIHFPVRKRKFCENDRPFYYYVVRADLKLCLVLKGEDIEDVYFGLAQEPAEFYDIPKSLIVRYVNL